MARTRSRYRPEALGQGDKERLLLAFGQARDCALRFERSVHLSDPKRGLGQSLRAAIDAIGLELTGDRQFFWDAGSTSTSGYIKLLHAVRARGGQV
jgi:hypothetical protein